MAVTGRPRLLTPELMELALRYKAHWGDDGDVIPTAEGLALYMGCSVRSVRYWAEDEESGEDFLQLYEWVMDSQARKLINGGITGDFKPAITAMMLAKHGYSAKTENTQTLQGPGGEPLGWNLIPVVPHLPEDTDEGS